MSNLQTELCGEYSNGNGTLHVRYVEGSTYIEVWTGRMNIDRDDPTPIHIDLSRASLVSLVEDLSVLIEKLPEPVSLQKQGHRP